MHVISDFKIWCLLSLALTLVLSDDDKVARFAPIFIKREREQSAMANSTRNLLLASKLRSLFFTVSSKSHRVSIRYSVT